MIIDADTHISPIRSPITIPVEALIDEMNQSGVDKAICWLQPPYMREIDDSLAYIHQSVKRYPDRLLGFGWVDPHLGFEKGRETIRRCVEDYGFYGIKFNGAQNSYYIDDEEMVLPLIEEAAKTGKLLAFHIGADEYDYTHPYRVAKIARRFPETTILLAHMGGAGLPDLSKSCIEMAVECPNLHLIASNIGWKKAIAAIETLGAERVSFGSDTPFSVMHADVAAFQAFLGDRFSPEEARLVMGGNIERLLNL